MILATATALFASSCDREQQSVSATHFKSAETTLSKRQLARSAKLDWLEDVRLEESEDVINVEIAVRPTTDGEFLVADAQEAQIRRYSPSGSLVLAFGSSGSGPQQFHAPSVAVPLQGDTVLVSDLQATLSITIPSADTTVSRFHLPLGPVYDADVIDDSRVLISGRSLNSEGRLHVVDYRSGEILRSFFAAPVGDRRSISAVGLTNSTIWGDTVATVFALSDTIYYFDINGRKLGQQEFPSERFREWKSPPESRYREQLQEWYTSFSYATEIFRPSDDLIIVQYQDRGTDLTPRWRLVGLDLTGRLQFDLVDTPRLLAVRRQEGELVFKSPGSLTPNNWSIASLR